MSRIGCWGCLLGVAIALGNTFNAYSALAQITPDGTLPNNSVVNINGSIFNITGGTQAGGNLFHSFKDFSVPTGSGAFFNNALSIQNIISRVTGGSVSNIDGLIRTLGTANLFLINPNGIVFGPNASLNVGGSFLASTANAIQFGDIGFFSATNPEAPSPLLTINPSALVSNQIAAAIQNSSTAPAGQAPSGGNASGLRVPDGRSLLLVGGDINMDGGRLRAYGGRVELGGLADSGTVGLGVDGNNVSLSFPDNATRANVSLTNGASIRVDAGGGGSIAVNARNLNILGGSTLNAGIGQGLGSISSQAGDITLNATGEIKIVGSNVFNDVRSLAVGNGGNITISSRDLSLTDGVQLTASTFGQGNAGSVSVQATNSVELDKSDILSNVESGGVGKGGNININAATLSLKDGAQLITVVRGASSTQPAGRGDAGNVTVDVTGDVTISGVKNGFRSAIFSSVGTGATGNGGNITISSGDFSLTDGGRLSASTSGQGNAGSVLVRATNSVELDNANILSTVQSGGVGKGGNININAVTLSLKDGAQLQTAVREASSTQPAGRGDAGNVTVDVTDSVTISGERNGFGSAIFSSVGTGATGNGGNISISSGDFSLTDGAQIVASTSGQGNAGSVSVRGTNSVELVNNAAILSAVESGGVGKGGNININAATLSLKDNAQLVTAVRETSSTQPAGRGDAGNVTVDVTGDVTISGVKNGFRSAIFSSVGAGATGNGGNITISSGDFSLNDGAQIAATTFGQGNAGNVSVRATNSVELDKANIFSAVELGGVGKGGNISINAATLSLKDGAQLITSVREAFSTQPAGRGNAGNVTVDVTGDVTISGERNGFSSAIASSVGTGVTGNGGNISISSRDFSLTDGAQLTASTFGQGNAGNVSVRATNSVELVNNAAILSAVGSGGVGKGGNININAATLSLKDSAQLLTSVREASSTQPAGRGDAGNVNVDITGNVTISGVKGFRSAILSSVGTGATGNGGNITISSGNFFLTNGARINASTSGQGNAGSVSLQAKDSVSLVNADILSSVESGGVGNGGNININAATLSLKDSAQITASSTGDGAAGNIDVDTRSIRLSDRSTISANTVAGQGNINLSARDLLLLRRGSNITTNATGTASGGNITINAPSGLIVAVPNENSDITANAFSGQGGNVTIRAAGIFNIAPLSRQELERLSPNDLNPNNLPTNDITAISQQNPTFSGQVSLNTPDADQSLGLVELPTVLAGTSELIAETTCAGVASTDSDTEKSRFTFTGRGGLPPSPYEPLSTDVVWLDTRLSMIASQQQRSEKPAAKPPSKAETVEIIPATGWVFDGKGKVTLISHTSSRTSLGSTPAGCAKQ